MNFYYKTLLLGAFLAMSAIVSPAFGQDVCANFEANQALYEKYTNNYKGTLEQMKTAVASGKEYIQTYGACEGFSQQTEYLKKAVPKLELKVNEAMRYARFDNALRGKKGAEEIYASGKDILKFEPEKLDVLIVLATVGLDEAADNKNFTFNNESINYAKSVIRLLEANAKSEHYGVLQYELKSRENSLGWMNYTIGYIMYYGQKNKEDALPYFYKATQVKSETKDRYFIYALFGDQYRDKAIKLGEDIVAKIEDNRKIDPNKDPETYETKMMFALQKGYAERAIDAYARAYEIGRSAKPAASETYLNDLKQTLETFYKFRFLTDSDATTDVGSAVMTYVASVSSKPFPNPTTEVQPVDPPVKEESTIGAAEATSTAAATSMATPAKPAAKVVVTTGGEKGKSEADKTNNKP